MQFNDHEGLVVRREREKADVEIAGTRTMIRVHCRHITLLPTFKVSRCKLRGHCTVTLTFHLEPVFWWPQTLTGTYYDWLRVDRLATAEEIRSAFRKLSVALHPDKNQTNAEKATKLFQQILEAYECLKDDSKRMLYDHQIGTQAMNFFRNPFW